MRTYYTKDTCILQIEFLFHSLMFFLKYNTIPAVNIVNNVSIDDSFYSTRYRQSSINVVMHS